MSHQGCNLQSGLVVLMLFFYKAFQVTADAPEIYMQEFWASAYVHNRSVRFKMNNKKHIIGLDQFRDILQICPKVGIRKITDVNVNKMHQPGSSFVLSSTNSPQWTSFSRLRTKIRRRAMRCTIPFHQVSRQLCMDKILQFFDGTKVIDTMPEMTQCSLQSMSFQGMRTTRTIPPKTKGSKKKADTDTITKIEASHCPQRKEVWKRKAEDYRKKILIALLASGSGADEGTGVTPGVPDAPDYDSEDDISWKSSDNDQDDEQAQDDEDADKNDVNETKQDDEDDDEHDDNETYQNDDDEEQTESDDDDDSFDPTIHTPSRISSSDDEDSDNEDEGTNVEGSKSDEDATYEEDQGNEAVENTNTDLDGRDDVMTDSSSVSSGFVSNMLNPNQDTGVDDIFGQHTEATSLIDTPVTAIMEPSFTAQINRPPTPYPLVIQTQQPPILTPATTTSSSLQNLPNFASLFGFDYRLKALEDNFFRTHSGPLQSNWKYDRIRGRGLLLQFNNFLDSIDEGMEKKLSRNKSKRKSPKLLKIIEKLVTIKLESEFWSDIQESIYKALVDAYEDDKICKCSNSTPELLAGDPIELMKDLQEFDEP
ncbi:hypothetical protein Tco_0103815 [Tanacetum coccineum]